MVTFSIYSSGTQANVHHRLWYFGPLVVPVMRDKVAMKFTKMQAAGNDYLLVETGDRQRDWSEVAVAMLDRHYGIGADGLLLMLPSSNADFQMRIFNTDGSESNTCGNGLRCMVKYFADRELVDPETREITVETMSGSRKATASKKDGKVTGIRTGMGIPAFGKKDIPVVIGQGRDYVDIKSMTVYPIRVDGEELTLNILSMGNPQSVHFSQDPVANFPLSRIGPEVENHIIFPDRANFEVARVLSRKQVEARVWERGVGETLASGSGACAVAVAAHLHEYIDNKVDIKMPGGILEVEWDGTGEVFISGPAGTVFTGEWPD